MLYCTNCDDDTVSKKVEFLRFIVCGQIKHILMILFFQEGQFFLGLYEFQAFFFQEFFFKKYTLWRKLFWEIVGFSLDERVTTPHALMQVFSIYLIQTGR